MTETEKLWFQKELDGNKKLREEVSLRKRTDMVLKNHDTIQFRKKLLEIEISRAKNAGVKKRGKNIPLKYAAVVAGLILAGSIYMINNSNLTNEEIVNRFYKPYEEVSNLRSQQAVINSDYSRALDYYNIHDYRNAAFYFSKVLSSDVKFIESTMYYGVSSYEEKNYSEAELSFKKVIDNDENLYLEDAQWYLALCYLQTNENARALSQLNLIRKSESIYRKDAGRMLRKLKH
jgi:TolA-binding protein